MHACSCFFFSDLELGQVRNKIFMAAGHIKFPAIVHSTHHQEVCNISEKYVTSGKIVHDIRTYECGYHELRFQNRILHVQGQQI